jgi:uncharacterized membrane protein
VSTLAAIAYPDRDTAEKAREELVAATRDKLIARVKPYGGEIIQTSLSTQEEQNLRDALGAGAAAG